MTAFRNTSEQRRIWPDIIGPDGRTLELDAGEVVELDSARQDRYLKPVREKIKKPAEPVEKPTEPAVPVEKKEPTS
jgi:hypothetical protein